MGTKARLIKNALRCLTCGAEIESKHRYDFVRCDCPSDSDTAIFVDGGLFYQRVGYGMRAELEDISEWEEYES